MDHLLQQSQELVRLGCFHTDTSSKVSTLALRLLEKADPLLKNKASIEEEDWDEKELIFESVMPIPQSRNDKAPTAWEKVTMEVKRITDKRGASSRIEVKHPFLKDVKVLTPWYCIPNIVDFEVSEKLGQNAALLLINSQLSRAKHEEALIPFTGTKPEGWSREEFLNSYHYLSQCHTPSRGHETPSMFLKSLIGKVNEGNTYIKQQFQNLAKLKLKQAHVKYWEVCLHLLSTSNVFFLVSLYKWNPIFYKSMKIRHLVKLIRDYKSCALGKTNWNLRQVWIDSPPGKPRLLTIAPPGVRLFLSALNNFLLFWSNEILDNELMHGFFYARGVNTYWHSLLSSDMKLLKESPNILELDLASCFKNINKSKLIQVLARDYQLPLKIVGIVSHYINLEVPIQNIHYPSSASYAESIHNTTAERSHMGIYEGLPISPWLANIMIHHCLKEAGWLDLEGVKVRIYADDLSIYLTLEGYNFMGQNFVEDWNKNTIFIDHGIQIDKGKSQWVKRDGVWLTNLKLLGLSYDGKLDTLTAKTRGRAATPFSPGKSPKDFLLETNYNITNYIVQRITEYYPELAKKLTDLQQIKDINSLFTHLRPEFNTIVAMMYQGGENGKTKISSWEYEAGSILDLMVKNKNFYIKFEVNMTNFSSYLFTYLLDALNGEYSRLGTILSLDKPKSLLKLKFEWKPSAIIPYEGTFIPPPFKPSKFYKKWKLMGAEEQGQWDFKFEEWKKEAKRKETLILNKMSVTKG